ncbi:MAG: Gfo/Idh/MocA family oxidoreductase, partial [Planctomycetota bacterium]
MTQSPSRRRFIQSSAALGAAGVGFWTSSRPARLHAEETPNQRLAAACIGVGGKGSSDTDDLKRAGAEVVALCDVDGKELKKKQRMYPDAKTFQDFRDLFDAMGDRIDLVSVSTPDHTHCSAAVRAMSMGKHVYCQKPLTWSIGEARMMREVAKSSGVVTQMGNQGNSQDGS